MKVISDTLTRKRIGLVSTAWQFQLKNNYLVEGHVLNGKYAAIGLHQTVSSDELVKIV